MPAFRFLWLLGLCVLLGACASDGGVAPKGLLQAGAWATAGRLGPVPTRAGSGWHEFRLPGKQPNQYSEVQEQGRVAMRVESRASVSMLRHLLASAEAVLSDDEKDIYKTAFELDQRWIIDLAADRTPEICQSQSVNVFLPGDVDKWDLHMLHWQAWERGVKSLYYLRSKSVQRAAFAGADMAVDTAARADEARTDYEECLACQ